MAAPTANPKNGTKNSKPNSIPQNAPPSAPAPVVLLSCLVLGFLAPTGQVTMEASCTVINCCNCSCCSLSNIISAPSAVGNFSTVNVVMVDYSFRFEFVNWVQKGQRPLLRPRLKYGLTKVFTLLEKERPGTTHSLSLTAGHLLRILRMRYFRVLSS